MILSVIILAAGQGTRMNSYIPKVFHEVGNQPMIYHVLDLSQKLKAKSTTVVISKKLEDLGASAIMPLASPIGSGRGIRNKLNLSMNFYLNPNFKIINTRSLISILH